MNKIIYIINNDQFHLINIYKFFFNLIIIIFNFIFLKEIINS